MGRKDFTLLTDVDVIDDILLDERNPRIRAAGSQQDCIDRVLRKREQMQNLIESIAKEGLSTTPILLTSSTTEKGKWVVKDGNRRVTALKLLNDPSLCTDPEFNQKIVAIADAHKDNIPRKIDCLSSENPEAIAREVVLRHSGELGGVGQIDWSSYLRTIYLLNNDIAADYKRAGQYLLWAENHDIVVDDDFPITNVSRFLSVKNIRALGLDVVDDELALNIDIKTAINMATRIIDDFGTKKKSVNSVFTPELAEAYLNDVRKDAGLLPINTPLPVSSPTMQPSTGAKAPAPVASPTSTSATSPLVPNAPATTGTSETATPKPKVGRPPAKPSWDRRKLFWVGAPQPSIPSSETKMRGVLLEIGQIKDVRVTPLTTAFLIRALIELSEKHYRTKYGLDDKRKLADNITAACDSMVEKKYLTLSQMQLVKSYTVTKKDDVGIFNVDTLQKYLHRETHLPAPQTINMFWDELYSFVHACWK